MTENQDPALLQEDVGDDVDTATDPQVEEEAAESSEESEEGAGAGVDTPPDDQKGEGDAEPEIEISIKGEEPPPARKDTQPWVKELREKQKALAAENAELKRRLQGQMQPETAVDAGPKPTLLSCEFNEERYEQELDSWKERKRKEASHAESTAKHAEDTARFWKSRGEVYAQGKEQLLKQLPEYEDAEAAVKAAFDLPRQNLILSVADNPALVVAALGQRPKLLEEFAKEADHFRFAAKLAKLEANLSTTQKPKSNVPPPEQKVRGSGPASGGKDATLERLRAQADKTGNRTPVVEYLRKKREAKR